METVPTAIKGFPSRLQDIRGVLGLELCVLDGFPICDKWRYREGGYMEIRACCRGAVRPDGARVPASYFLPARAGQVHYVSHCHSFTRVTLSFLWWCYQIPQLDCRHAATDRLSSAIHRCLFPSPHRVYFSDVVFADILTSFAKVLGDVWLCIYMLLPSGSLLTQPAQDGLTRWILPTIMR